jgi:riboflavin synthase
VFTGIVRERGRVVSAEPNGGGVHLRIVAPETAGAALGETIARTTLGGLGPGAEVNLEPALRAGEPLGGHFVQGHVDGRARVTTLQPEGDGTRLRLHLEPELLRYCVEKGSIALDGVSLTIAALHEDGVDIALVPFTLEHTTLGALAPGDEVNVEVDLLAKYAERLASA